MKPPNQRITAQRSHAVDASSAARPSGRGVGLHGSTLHTGWTVASQQSIVYDVRPKDGLFDPASSDLIEAGTGSAARGTRLRRFVVIDHTVDALYGDQIRAYFDAHRVEAHFLTLDAPEPKKTMESVFAVTEGLDAFGISRRHEPIIAIGGGVLMDIVGLAASLYRRSTPYIRVPTTLMGLVDAGIGAKTGVNHSSHKNRLGTYFPPKVVFLDRTFLATLEPRQLSNGLGEILKMALIKDRRLFELLERYGDDLIESRFQDDVAAEEVIGRAIHGMLEELQCNLWEEHLERIVDYGHTFSPVLEMRALPSLLHGEAVCIDMAVSTALGVGRNLVSEEEAERIFATMRRLRLPAGHELCEPDFLWHALQDSVKHRDGFQRTPLPVGIGDATFVNDLVPSELTAAARMLTVGAAR